MAATPPFCRCPGTPYSAAVCRAASSARPVMTHVVQNLAFDRKASVPALVDPFGRAITYLRVSVTDRCDFRCVYCMSENMTFLPKADLLSLEELDRMCGAFIARGVRKLRLTCGEPLVRRSILTLFASLSRHLSTAALVVFTRTTKWYQLAKYNHTLERH